MAGDYGPYYFSGKFHSDVCQKCGKPTIYIGDVPEGDGPKPWCECKAPEAAKPYAQGWVCPKCGRVNAPWVAMCPCYSPITFTTNTSNTVTFPNGVQFTPTVGGDMSKEE